MSGHYTIISYPNAGYLITEDGEIVRPDGTPYEGIVSNEHLAIAEGRKRLFQTQK